METPLNKGRASAFRKINLFTSSAGKIQPNEYIFNSISSQDNCAILNERNFSFSKFLKSSDKKEKSPEVPKTQDKSLQTEIFSSDKENFYEVNQMIGCFKISNVNFNINLSFLEYFN
jgi:hypothetical protein